MFLNVVTDALGRGWENFTARPEGVMNFRFIIQPILAGILAIRSGINDAKINATASASTNFLSGRSQWSSSLWKGIRVPFFIGAILDSIYQLIIHQGIFLLELLFTVALLVIIPYYIIRVLTGTFAKIYFAKKTSQKK